MERHQRASTAVTSNRELAKWRAVMAGPLLPQIAIGRLQNAAYEPIIEGEAYRRRQKLGGELGDALRRAEHRAAEPGGGLRGGPLLLRHGQCHVREKRYGRRRSPPNCCAQSRDGAGKYGKSRRTDTGHRSAKSPFLADAYDDAPVRTLRKWQVGRSDPMLGLD